ncbi:F0F1 ATP synthase subunit B [Patescibacteria group bacterium]
MELIEGLGLDWKILLAQVVNFFVLLFILYKFAYKPLTKMMRERSAKIDKSLKEAKQIGQNLKASEDNHEKTMRQARKEAQELMNKAKVDGEKIKEEMTVKAKVEVEKIVGHAHTEIAQAKDNMISEAKEELGSMVIGASESILREKLDTKADKELIDKAINKVK